MELKLEAIVIPVSDVDRAKAFYETAGFATDVDMGNEDFRVVQLTPPGSACSIIVGIGIPQAAPGSSQGLHLVVRDLVAARAELLERGVEVGEPSHFDETGPPPRSGVHPDRTDYGSYATFSDPDGNAWVLQEVPSR